MQVSRARWAREQYNALDGDFEVYVAWADGRARFKLTTNPGYDLWVAWAPDGERIAFGSARAGNTDISTVHPDGTGLTRLTSDSGTESAPAWSPDGSTVVYAARAGGPWQLWTMNADGTGQRPLTSDSLDHQNPAVSPDGSQVAYYGQRNGRDWVFVESLRGPIAPRVIAAGVFPGWAPDGRSVVFGRNDSLFRAGLDGSAPQLLVTGTEFGRYSPDGRFLAYVAGSFPDTCLEVLNLDTGRRRRLERPSP
jgi:TolB protein